MCIDLFAQTYVSYVDLIYFNPNYLQISNLTLSEYLYVTLPEEKVDFINMNCQNVDNPSNIACAGHWFYWHLEGGTLQGGEWRLDTSLKLVCRGMRLYKCIKLYCLILL